MFFKAWDYLPVHDITGNLLLNIGLHLGSQWKNKQPHPPHQTLPPSPATPPHFASQTVRGRLSFQALTICYEFVVLINFC